MSIPATTGNERRSDDGAITVTLAAPGDFAGWRDAARALALAGTEPDRVVWTVADRSGDRLDGKDGRPFSGPPSGRLTVDKWFLDRARAAVRHRDENRFALLYTALWRLQREAELARDRSDPLMARIERMAGDVRAAPRDPAAADRSAAWRALRDAAHGCTRCHLHACASATVFGEGPVDAPIVFVGEQPGDREDLAGRPFVGPAGQLFDRALADAEIDRETIYVTNAVKHFKFVARGTRRIHQTPDAEEIAACRPWLDEERRIVRPRLTVALGASAARALFGRAMPVGRSRGRPHALPDGAEGWITLHPSYLLRVPDAAKAEAYAGFVADLCRILARID